MEILGLGAVAFLAFFVLSTILGSFFTVNTAQVAVITRFGKFLRVAEPGLNWKVPFIDSVSGRISLRVNQITLTMETKTKDNVFVTIPISVQNRVRPEKAFDAYYKLSDPAQQIKSYVEQVILGHVPGMTLDEVFASQSGIAAAVKKELDVDMAGFGYEIVNVLVTDIVPDAKVKSAMNDINAAQREQVAANARGEAEKILVVKKAEAEAESKALQGQGIANQRKAIIEGLQGSIEQFQKVVGGTSTSEVMQLVLVTQYFDTIKSIGENDKTNTLFLSHSPGAVKEISDQVLQSMIGADRASSGRLRPGFIACCWPCPCCGYGCAGKNGVRRAQRPGSNGFPSRCRAFCSPGISCSGIGRSPTPRSRMPRCLPIWRPSS
jgi:regulator of protease activity HflC (stomatin/prohibitin superfamily)